MLEVINIKIEKEIKEKLERLVRRRVFKNKSEAVRKIIQEHFEEHPELFADKELEEAEKAAEEISDGEFYRIASEAFRGAKTAAEIVAEGRDRYP